AWCRPPARELRPLAYHVAPRGPSCSDVPHCPTIPSNLLSVHLNNPTEFVEQKNTLHYPRFHGSPRLSPNHLVAGRVAVLCTLPWYCRQPFPSQHLAHAPCTSLSFIVPITPSADHRRGPCTTA